MSNGGNTFEFNPTEKEALRKIIRDEIGMFMHEGPGWWNNHNPLEYHKCGRCGIILPMGSGCLCGSLGNTALITTEGIT